MYGLSQWGCMNLHTKCNRLRELAYNVRIYWAYNLPRPTTQILCCDMPEYVYGNCLETQGDFGEQISCAEGSILEGICGSGRRADCDGSSHIVGREKVVPRLRECCRQSQAAATKTHQTRGPPFNREKNGGIYLCRLSLADQVLWGSVPRRHHRRARR